MPATSGQHTRGLRGQRGSAIVEFTLVSLMFFALVFGLVEFGRALFAYSTVSSAAREGVRYASVHGSDSKSPASKEDIRNDVLRKTRGLNYVTAGVSWQPDNQPAG